MILCPHCGASNNDDASQCAWCELPLHPKAEEASVPSAPGQITGDAPRPAADPGDPLSGLQGLLPPVPLPPISEVSEQTFAEPTEQERQDAELFRLIATEPAPLEPPRQPPTPPTPPLLSRGARGGLALLLLLAVLCPLLSKGRLDAGLRPPSDSAALTESLGLLQAGDRVLVVVDYAPSAAAELASMFDAILAELAERGVGLIMLSTRIEGVDLARQAIERLSSTHPGLHSGQDYALLGYLAGDSAGLRLALTDLPAALAQTNGSGGRLTDLPLLRSSDSIRKMDALLVLVDDANLARRWVEQIGASTPAPLLMVTTAAIEPLVVPYAGSEQVAALVSGAYGGLSYTSSGQNASLYSADGFLALWVLLAGAFVWGLLRSPLTRREGRR